MAARAGVLRAIGTAAAIAQKARREAELPPDTHPGVAGIAEAVRNGKMLSADESANFIWEAIPEQILWYTWYEEPEYEVITRSSLIGTVADWPSETAVREAARGRVLDLMRRFPVYP